MVRQLCNATRIQLSAATMDDSIASAALCLGTPLVVMTHLLTQACDTLKIRLGKVVFEFICHFGPNRTELLKTIGGVHVVHKYPSLSNVNKTVLQSRRILSLTCCGRAGRVDGQSPVTTAALLPVPLTRRAALLPLHR
jgi:hypothetical protein